MIWELILFVAACIVTWIVLRRKPEIPKDLPIWEKEVRAWLEDEEWWERWETVDD